MGTPVFQVAVRNKDGQASLFRLSHAEIQTHEQVMAMVRDEIPEAAVILVSVA